MSVRMKAGSFLGIFLVMLLCMPGFVTAESFTVGTSYYSEDTLSSTDPWNEYRLTANSDKKIEYSFEVVGTGRILVLFVKGHDVDESSNYYVSYSAENPTRSYSKTFPVDSSDGTKFTILITTEGDEEVTYKAKIKVVDTAISDFLCGAVALFVFIFGFAVVLALVRSRKKKRVEYTPPQQYQPPAVYQQQQAYPSQRTVQKIPRNQPPPQKAAQPKKTKKPVPMLKQPPPPPPPPPPEG